ncbi:MAG TPA: energy transducer TonB [Rhodanobacteraceae bacterium]
MKRLPLLVFAAIATAGFAATPALAQYRSHLRKVAPSQLTNYWIRTNTYVDADAPNSGQGLDKIGCAAVTYIIGTDGKTHDVKVVRVIPSTSDFQITARSFVQALHYAPAENNTTDMPVATYFIIPFNVPSGNKTIMQRMLKACHLPGYGD